MCICACVCVHCVFRMTLWPVHRGVIKYFLFLKSGFGFIILNQSRANRFGGQHTHCYRSTKKCKYHSQKKKCLIKQISRLRIFNFPGPLCMCEYERQSVSCDIWELYRGVPKDLSVLWCSYGFQCPAEFLRISVSCGVSKDFSVLRSF
jgi:hypothetical protein